MSFSVGVSGSRQEIEQKAEESFNSNYPTPDPGVKELFEVALTALADFSTTSKDEGNYSVSINGHAKQGDSDRDYLNVSIGAVS